MDNNKLAEITGQELDVLHWVKEGKCYEEIGRILSISTKTVEALMMDAMRKLEVDNKISAIVCALRYHLISL